MTKENKAAAAAFSLKDGLEPVSDLTTNRLSVYLRCLNVLDAAGVRTVLSQALAEQFHLNAAQIRKDLAYFGEFGVRGVGYYVKELRRIFARSSGSTGASGSRSWGRATSAWRWRTTPDFATRDSRSPRCSTTSATRSASGRAGASDPRRPHLPPPSGVSASDRGHRGPAAVGAAVLKEVVDAGIKAVLNFFPGALKVPST